MAWILQVNAKKGTAMSLTGILFTLIIALVIGLLFYYTFGYRGPWDSFWTFLLVLVLAGVAADLWVSPVGPVLYDVTWAPILFVVLLFALFLAAATPADRKQLRKMKMEDSKRTIVAVSSFFWVLLFFLMLAILLGVLI
jgi:hypothetical protein